MKNIARLALLLVAVAMIWGCSDGDSDQDPTNELVTVAGTGLEGMGIVGNPGPQTALAYPSGIGIDADGRVLIADFKNHRVLRVDDNGVIQLVAGTGKRGFSGDGALAIEAELSFPCGVTADKDGGILISDTNNHRIRRVDREGRITTLVEGLKFPEGVADDGQGGIYIAEAGGHRISHWTPEGGLTTLRDTDLVSPYDVALHPDGRLIIADYGGHQVLAIDLESGTLSIVAGTGKRGFSGDNGPATLARLAGPQGVTVAPDGTIYIADTGNHRVRMVRRDGTILTAVGDGLSGPDQVVFDPRGELVIADTGHHQVRKFIGSLPEEPFFGRYTVVQATGIFEGSQITSSPEGVDVGDGRRLAISGEVTFFANGNYLADLTITEDGNPHWLTEGGFTRFEGSYRVDATQLAMEIPLWGATKLFSWSWDPTSQSLSLKDVTPEGDIPLIHGDVRDIQLTRDPTER